MIIVKNATRAHPSEEWMEVARGEIDEYGEPFQLIELQWLNTPLHRMTEYAKTRGFEDTIITANTKTGGVKINYRENGSVMWLRKKGIGPFTGLLAKTPKNMRRLASHFEDRLWKIMDPVIASEVKALWDSLKEKMTEKDLQFHNDRITSTHSSKSETSIPGYVARLPAEDSATQIAEDRRQLNLQMVELKRRELEVAEREGSLNKSKIESIAAGEAPSKYGQVYLEKLKMHEIRSLARKMGIPVDGADKKTTIVQRVLDRQNGIESIPEAAQEPEDQLVAPSRERGLKQPEEEGIV